jgi:hypothetical protein
MTSRWNGLAGLALATIVAALPAGGSLAADGDADTDGPRFELVTYLWGEAFRGDVASDRVSTEVDVSFSDIVDHLNVGAFASLGARYGRWVGLLDVQYAQLESDTSTHLLDLGPGPLPSVPARADVELEQGVLDLKGGYRLLDLQTPGATSDDDPRRLQLDLLAGARVWYLRTEIDVQVGPLAGSSDASKDWVDPLVGTRVSLDLTPRLRLAFLGDIGGFSVGSSSRSTYQALGLLRWNFGERWSSYAGYRVIGIDRDAALESDVYFAGPLLGIGFAF